MEHDMETRTAEVRDTLYRIQQALAGNPLLSDGLESPSQHLDRTVAAFDLFPRIQGDATKAAIAATQAVLKCRHDLRTIHMRPIALIATRRLANTPKFKLMALPRRTLPDAELVIAARAMARAARGQAPTFWEVGLRGNFVDCLMTATSRLDTAVAERRRLLAERAQATAKVKDLEREGRCVIKIIDGFVRPRVAGNADCSAAWNTVVRLRGAESAGVDLQQ
jgi:hypothetical protein